MKLSQEDTEIVGGHDSCGVKTWEKSMCDANKVMKSYYDKIRDGSITHDGFYFDFNEEDNNFVL